jgi:hypothetical protein
LPVLLLFSQLTVSAVEGCPDDSTSELIIDTFGRLGATVPPHHGFTCPPSAAYGYGLGRGVAPQGNVAVPYAACSWAMVASWPPSHAQNAAYIW